MSHDLPRLGATTPLPDGVTGPRVLPESVGIVHLGWGAFHRAHQAVYTEDAMALGGDRSWGILGDVERTPVLVPALREQDGRYTVLTSGVDDDGTVVRTARVIGSVVDVAYPGDETPRLLAAMAADSTRLITLTVTEKGYTRTADGHLDLPQVAADVTAFTAALRGEADPVAAVSAIGLLVRGLLARFHAGGSPVTVLSCDNIPHNGRVLWSVVDEFIAAADTDTDAFRSWLADSTTWPSSMVDRITPAATDATRAEIAAVLGARDEAGILAEPFSQWVIEDRFAAGRPAWELAGAEFTTDVTAWENAKLFMLNGTHSLIAYAARLLGHTTMADAVGDPRIATAAREYMMRDALPTLTVPEGADLAEYGEGLLRRFANPATGHTTTQVSTDGSQKLPIRWGRVVADSLAAGRVPRGVAFGLAAWSEFVRRAVRDGIDLGDPAGAETLTATVRAAVSSSTAAPEDLAATLIALPGLLPDGAGTDPGLVAAVVAQVRALTAVGDDVI
ncbi:mannitol dehydrogenase family protein [Cellulomonas taurus]|uniref:mannitol dehydrogenase family protein n=1 Tax=Cellulomonas taurus TaxID=2729175 RepID=UPI001FEBFA3D|nr:mannitol dehydrogenase family protein [Cellulomonas taurus]